MLPLIAAIAVIAAGCGGSSSSADAGNQTYSVEAETTMTTANVSKAQFVSQANKLCREAWVTILRNFAEYSGWHETKTNKKKNFVESVQLSLLAGIEFHIFDEIRNLGSPQGEEQAIEEIIGPMQSAIERGQKKLAPISSVAKVSKLFGEYDQLARRYGLDDCLVDTAHLHKIEA